MFSTVPFCSVLNQVVLNYLLREKSPRTSVLPSVGQRTHGERLFRNFGLICLCRNVSSGNPLTKTFKFFFVTRPLLSSTLFYERLVFRVFVYLLTYGSRSMSVFILLRGRKDEPSECLHQRHRVIDNFNNCLIIKVNFHQCHK